jgi:CheY-like chemotaxis protein
MWSFASQLGVMAVAACGVWLCVRWHRAQVALLARQRAALERANQDLAQTLAHQDEFMAAMGHELRTPMNAILGLNSVLRDALVQQPQDVEVVDHMRHATQQLLHVVNDILDFSQLQAGRLKLREDTFALSIVLQTLLARYQPQATAKNLSLTLDAYALEGVWFKGDASRLMQILDNLLGNALKFTETGSVQLRAQPLRQGVRFEVTDTGEGIAPELLPHVFEMTQTQTQRLHGGVGLGLPICERLVRLQGGQIGVGSVLMQGTQFWFELPLPMASAPEVAHTSNPTSTSSDQALRILLVDDNAVNLVVARLMLHQCFSQAQTVEVSDGNAALQTLQAQTFDVVLMDVFMPDMDGLETTRRLRAQLPAPANQTPVLALTASTDVQDHERCIAAGMNGVVHKPLVAAELISAITAVVASTHGRSQA